MKKMLICCGALCMTMLLFCVSAFAAVDVKSSDDTVTVTVNETAEKGPEITVSKKSGVDAENLYLVMVQEGTELPTSENLYYMDVDKFSAAFDMKAYPKDGFLTAGKTYTVYLSDWSTANNGGRKAVATLTVGKQDPFQKGKRGDVDGKEGIDVNDAIYILKYLANMEGYDLTGKENANVDGKGGIDVNDAIYVLKYLANMEGYDL